MERNSFKGFWWGWDSFARMPFFAIVNSKNQGRISREGTHRFTEDTFEFNDKGIYSDCFSLIEKRRGEERFVGNTRIPWPAITEEEELFIES
jgi:hypothetical protein